MESPQVEAWKVYRRLIGHDNDVQDLGWSQDSSILVSVGLDSKVVVWSGYTFEKLKTLSGHQSHVKGITFDPANKYFATASDDRTIKIWRFSPPGPNSTSHDQTNNFTLDKTIATPFNSSPLTTYFRRCSWSPDGQHIAGANAVNGPVSAAVIVERGTWDTGINLIGHEAPSEVCAFSPRLFSFVPEEQRKPGDTHTHTVIACAGQDKALSIWITIRPRPLTIIQDIASKTITDLAFSPDGHTVFATSLDGSILAVVFMENELGHEMRPEENDKALAKFGASRRGMGIIEGPEALLLEDKSKEGEMRGVEGRMGALMGQTSSSQPALNGVSRPETNGITTQMQPVNGESTPPVQTNGNIEKLKEDPNAVKLERLKSRVQITKDGKKRIAPLLVSSGDNESSLPRPQLMSTSGNQAVTEQPQQILDLQKPFDGLPPGGLAALLLGNRRKYAQMDGQEDDTVDKRLALSRKDGATPIVTNTANGLLPAKFTSGSLGQDVTPEFIRPAVTNPSLTVSQVRLAIPKVRTHIVRSHGGDVTDETNGAYEANPNVIFEARNQISQPLSVRAPDHEPCRITVTKRGQPVFSDFLPRNVLLVTGNAEYWAAACEDGSVYAWTPAGRRLFNAIILEAQPVILECQKQYLLCITAVGLCSVWDVQTLTSPHPPVSLAPILDIAIHSLQEHPTRGPAVTGARLNSEGRIVVTLTNGEGYAYNPSLYQWQRLSELWWLVGSQYWNTTDSSVGNLAANSVLGDNESKLSAGVIPYLERSTTTATLARGRARILQRIVKDLLTREGFEGLEATVSIAHLENRVAAAMMLGAKADFQVYLYMYAKRIGAEGLKSKVEELLQGLMGDGDDGSERSGTKGDRWWGNETETLCGWPRKGLLKAVILLFGSYLPRLLLDREREWLIRPFAGKNRDLQRITVPYAKVMGITEGAAVDDDEMVS